MSKSFNMTDTSSLTTNAAVAEDGTPSAKRQWTSAETHFAPSSRLSSVHPGPFQSAYDITKQILESTSGRRGSTSDAPAPGLLPSPAPASTPQDLAPEGQKSKENAAEAQQRPKFMMKRTGTAGLPPGYSVPTATAAHDVNTAAKPSVSSLIPTSTPEDKAAAGAARAKQMKQISDAIHIGLNRAIDGWGARSPSRDSPASTTTAPSRPTSAGGPATDIAKTASPQSLAMKRKWASGEMDHVGQKAAETRRLNAERRMSVISISDNSTPESPAASSAPVPAPAVAKKPSLADYYRKRAGKAATTPGADSRAMIVVTDGVSPQQNTPQAAINAASDRMMSRRPIILPPKNSAKSPDPSAPPVPGTPFARSLSGRPYDMVANEGGRYVHGFGALFPDGYAPIPDPEGKGPRWTCPVKNCTHERTYLKSHGKHFVNDHKACLLNDDGDGTFTVVGYDMKQNAPVVVSRNPKSGSSTKPTTGIATVDAGEPEASQDAESAIVANDATSASDSAVPFFFTPSGRSYTTYPDNGGRTFGVLIPDSYERLVTSEEKPWVCPVVSCLSSWASQNGLAIHFARMHGGCTLNDNLDGTLSVLGRRDDDSRFQAVQGWGRRDAFVVRQSPMCSTDKRQINADVTKSLKDHPATPAQRVDPVEPSPALPAPPSQPRNHYLTSASNAQPVKGLEGGALEIWNYIRPHLTEFTECPDSSWIPELLKLPKVRDIIWDDSYTASNGFKDRVSRDVATMILQVTGEAPLKTCSRCRDGSKGPYKECIVISAQAPIDARLAFASCASCIYNGQGTYCTTKFWGKKRALEAAAEMPGQTTVQQAEADQEQPSMSVSGPQMPSGNGDHSPVRRSERVQVKEAIAQSAPYDLPVPARAASEDAPYVPYEGDLAPASSPPPRRFTRTFNRRSEEQTDLHPTNTENMEIQDWELAPGRLRSAAPPEDGELAETIAFSQPYLTANQSVPTAPDTTFRVNVVNSGSSVRFAATPDRVRICSVGAGKVKVRMQGEEEFDIGPHGMFRVLRGRSCVVLNRLYGDAVLHVTEVPDYS